MVFFTCDACGESMKKNAVDKHYRFQCRNCSVLSCVDCGKAFPGDAYMGHTKCISEEEKYSGKGFKPKPNANKGEVKQNSWLEQVHAAISKCSNTDFKLKSLLERLIDYPNIPRKKAKFENFIKNSMAVRNPGLTARTWDVIAAEMNKQPQTETVQNSNDALANGKENQTQPDKTNRTTGAGEEAGEDNDMLEKKLSKREKKEERRKQQHKEEKKSKKLKRKRAEEEEQEEPASPPPKKKKDKNRKHKESVQPLKKRKNKADEHVEEADSIRPSPRIDPSQQPTVLSDIANSANFNITQDKWSLDGEVLEVQVLHPVNDQPDPFVLNVSELIRANSTTDQTADAPEHEQTEYVSPTSTARYSCRVKKEYAAETNAELLTIDIDNAKTLRDKMRIEHRLLESKQDAAEEDTICRLLNIEVLRQQKNNLEVENRLLLAKERKTVLANRVLELKATFYAAKVQNVSQNIPGSS